MAQRYQFYTADVFTDRVFSGNPLAVFPWAEGLSTAQMHQVTREFNLSETVFVLPPENPQYTRRLRIFTPGREMAFAGHPTVGSAYVLAKIGELALDGPATDFVFEEGVGPVPVTIYAEEGEPVSAQLSAAQLPEVGPEPPGNGDLAAMLSLEESDLLGGKWVPQALSCGTPFLFIPVRDREALGRVRIDAARWEALLSDYWTNDLYLFCFDPEREGSDLRARMFAPGMGIGEDPATGAAATALAGYLAARDQRPVGTVRWVVEQGFEMGRPSIIEVEADVEGGGVTAVRVGGRSVMVSEGQMTVPAGWASAGYAW